MYLYGILRVSRRWIEVSGCLLLWNCFYNWRDALIWVQHWCGRSSRDLILWPDICDVFAYCLHVFRAVRYFATFVNQFVCFQGEHVRGFEATIIDSSWLRPSGKHLRVSRFEESGPCTQLSLFCGAKIEVPIKDRCRSWGKLGCADNIVWRIHIMEWMLIWSLC